MRDLSANEHITYLRIVAEADAAWNAGMTSPGAAQPHLPSRNWFAAARELDRIALRYQTECCTDVVT